MINVVILLKRGYLEIFIFDVVAILNWIVSNQLYLHLILIIMHQLARLLSSFNHQIILLLKRPLTQYWTSPWYLER